MAGSDIRNVLAESVSSIFHTSFHIMSLREGWYSMRDSGSSIVDTRIFICTALKKNIEVNTALTTYLRPEMLSARTPHAGFTVAQHLVHLCNDVKHWAGHIESERAGQLPTLTHPGGDDDLSAEWLKEMRRAWNSAEYLVIELMTECRPGEKANLPHTSIEMYALHLLVHDSYHRGQMIAALKAEAYAMPDLDDSLWSVWRS